MKRNLLLLNLALAGLLFLCGWYFRQGWREDRSHEDRVLHQKVTPPPVAPPVPSRPVEPMIAMKYIDVAQRDLFAPDRRPDVIVPAPPVIKEKPVPPFPEVHGVMSLGDGPPLVILNEKGKPDQRSYHAGDKIGEFAIVSFNNDEMVLSWDGKEFKKSMDDLAAKITAPPPSIAPDRVNPTGIVAIGGTNELGPGKSIGGDTKACQSGDTTAAGAVVNGMKKIVNQTLMGSSCRWVPAP